MGDLFLILGMKCTNRCVIKALLEFPLDGSGEEHFCDGKSR
jgi:hypothetical protein